MLIYTLRLANNTLLDDDKNSVICLQTLMRAIRPERGRENEGHLPLQEQGNNRTKLHVATVSQTAHSML